MEERKKNDFYNKKNVVLLIDFVSISRLKGNVMKHTVTGLYRVTFNRK